VASVARGRGGALADLNGDGRLDLAVVNRRAAMQVWRNATGDAGGWLTVRLRQEGANRDAVGAWVELRAGGRTQSQEMTVGGGHAGGRLGPLHFGLGAAERAEIRVIWPDGAASGWMTAERGRAWRVERSAEGAGAKLTAVNLW